MRCANKDKRLAEWWMDESEVWGDIKPGDVRTAGTCVAFKARGLEETNQTEGRRKEEEQSRRLRRETKEQEEHGKVWCPQSPEKGFEEGAVSYVKCGGRGLSDDAVTELTIDCICQCEVLVQP